MPHQHTASAGSAAAPAATTAAQHSPDDPFSLWGDPPLPTRPHQSAGGAAIADDVLEQYTAGSRSATPQQSQAPAFSDNLLDSPSISGSGTTASDECQASAHQFMHLTVSCFDALWPWCTVPHPWTNLI